MRSAASIRFCTISACVEPRWKFFRQQTRIADDSGQKVVEIVRNAAGQQTQALQLLRFPQRLLAAFLIADIPRDDR